MYPPRSSSLSLILEECKWGGNHIIMIKKKETVVSDFKIMSDLLYSRTAVQKNGLSFEKMIKKFLSLCYKIDIPHILMPAPQNNWYRHVYVYVHISYYIYVCCNQYNLPVYILILFIYNFREYRKCTFQSDASNYENSLLSWLELPVVDLCWAQLLRWKSILI